MSLRVERIATVGLWLLAAGLFLLSIVILGAWGVPGLLISLFPLMISGILFWRLTANAAGEGFVHFFLAPHTKLSAPPVSLTRVRALLASGQDDAAETELLALQEQHPELPEIPLLLLKLYDRTGRHDEGAAWGQRYFSSSARIPGEENYALLMLCCDQLLSLQQDDAAQALLLRESALPCYSAAQRAGISRRLTFLSGRKEK